MLLILLLLASIFLLFSMEAHWWAWLWLFLGYAALLSYDPIRDSSESWGVRILFMFLGVPAAIAAGPWFQGWG